MHPHSRGVHRPSPRKELNLTGLIIFIVIALVLTALITGGTFVLAYNKAMGVVALLACVLVFGGLTWWNWATVYQNDHWATCHVTGKDRGGNQGSYRIYTSDCGQLANEDSTLRAKFNSADIWQAIPDKGVVQLEIAGMRFGFMSQFPNVFGVRAVKN